MIIYFSNPRRGQWAAGDRRSRRPRHVDAPHLMSQWLPNVVNGWTVGAGHPNQLEVNAMIEGFLRHYV
jgi:hypothetical protein